MQGQTKSPTSLVPSEEEGKEDRPHQLVFHEAVRQAARGQLDPLKVLLQHLIEQREKCNQAEKEKKEKEVELHGEDNTNNTTEKTSEQFGASSSPSSGPLQHESEEAKKTEEEDSELDINEVDEEGNTPLHLAARLEAAEAIRLILEACPPLLDDGRAADHRDCNSRFSTRVEALNEHGSTPLQECVASASEWENKASAEQSLKLLCNLGSANVNMRDPLTGTPPLWECLSTGSTDMARILIQHGADIFCVSPEGESLLFPALASEQGELVKLLLESGVEVNRQNLEGFTPLHVAAYSSHEDIIRLLLDHQRGKAVKSLFVRNEQGNTPRMEAEMAGNETAAAVFREYEEKEIAKQRAKDPYYNPDGRDHFTYAIRTTAGAGSDSIFFNIVKYLDQPADICALEQVCATFATLIKQTSSSTLDQALQKKEEKTEEEENRVGSFDIWERLFKRWFGQVDVRGQPRLWSVVFGQGRPFFGLKVFLEGTWRDCFVERALISTVDPCTGRNVDYSVTVNFINGGGHSSAGAGVVELLQSTLIFPKTSFEYPRYAGTVVVVRACGKHRRVLLFPTPYQRTSHMLESTSQAKPDVCVICFPVFGDKVYGPIEVQSGEIIEDVPCLLVGVRDVTCVGELRTCKQQAVADALRKYCGDRCAADCYVECSVAENHGLSAMFGQVVSLFIGSRRNSMK